MNSILSISPIWCRRERLLDFLYLFTDFFSPFLAFACTYDSRFGSLWFRRFLQEVVGIRLNHDGMMLFDGVIYSWLALLCISVASLLLYAVYSYLDMYRGYRLLHRPNYTLRIIAVNLAFLGILLLVRLLTKTRDLPRSFVLIECFLNIVFTCFFRFALRKILRWVRHRTKRLDSPVLLIGNTPQAKDITRFVRSYRPHGMYIAERMPSRITGDLTNLKKILREKKIRSVIIADPNLALTPIMDVIELTAELGNISCTVVNHKLDVLPLKAGIPCTLIRGVPSIYFDALHSVLKRTVPRVLFSKAVAGLALLFLSPVFAVIAILIKATDHGPVFFKQDRYGINQKSFKMYKFRTMCVDAEAKLAALEAKNKMGKGGLFKIVEDPRVTPIGRFLRHYSLDELPQFINVFKGEMRIVGPRPLPERDYRNYYQNWHYGRHIGYPGLTCLWQVSGRSDIDFESMCILDLYYIRNSTWALDLSIFLRTIAVLFNGSGAY